MRKLNEDNTDGYLVFCIDGDTPKIIHNLEINAKCEADRLSAKHPNKVFCVCKVTYTIQTKLIPETKTRTYE